MMIHDRPPSRTHYDDDDDGDDDDDDDDDVRRISTKSSIFRDVQIRKTH